MALRRILCCTLGLCLVATLIPTNAWAGLLRLRVEEFSTLSPTGQGVVITDQLIGGDAATEEGIISVLMQPLSANILMSYTLGVSSTNYTGADGIAYSQLSLQSFSLTTSGHALVLLTLEDTGYGGGSTGKLTLTNSISGNLLAPKGSTLKTQSWMTSANHAYYVPDLGPDQTDPLAGPLAEIGYNPSGGTAQTFASKNLPLDGAFSGEAFKVFNTSGPTYSMFTQVFMDFSGAGSVNFSQDTLVAVPEPGTLLLLGVGMVGLARMSRRRVSIAEAA